MIAGVDGCKDKWIAAVDLGNGRTEIRQPSQFQEILEDRTLRLIVIDVPIGLPEHGPRNADIEVRRFLGKRGCCVFPAPIRPILQCHEWEDACLVRTSIEGKRISKQQFGILPKVCEVDFLLRTSGAKHVFEGHPEVSFALMNERSPFLIGKKRIEGKDIRSKLVCKCFPDAKARIAEYRFHLEDVLDAYALLWTARRIQLGIAERFPKTNEADNLGLRMEIVA